MFGFNIRSFYKSYSKKVWSLTLIVLIFVSRKTIFNVAREIGKFQTTLDRGTTLALLGIFLSLLAIGSNLKSFRRVLRKNMSFIAYYVICLSSFLWAGNMSTILFKATEVLSCFLVVAIIMEKINSMKMGLLYIIVLSTIITYMDVINGLRYGFSFHHTNAYTLSALIGLLLCLGAIHNNIFRWKDLRLFIILNALALAGGTSSASWVAFLIGCILLYSSDKRGIGFVRAGAVCVIIYLVYEYAYDTVFDIIFKGKSQKAIESGTGRQYIWEAAIASWKTSPWLGKGFLVGERSLGKYGLGLKVVSAHNSFISVLVGTGIVGMTFFVNFLARWMGRLFKYSRQNTYASMLFPVSAAIMVNCMGFPAIGSDWNYVAPCIYAVIAYTFLRIGIKNYANNVGYS